MIDAASVALHVHVHGAQIRVLKPTTRLLSSVIDIATWCALALALVSPTALMGELAAPPPSELEVKAAFVLNFIRFVYWASAPGEEDTSDLPICTLANSDFAKTVRQVAAGRVVGSRSISLGVNPKPDPSRCRVLIVDAAEYQFARPALDAVRNAPVLTIGNGPGLIEIGGMFELIVQDRNVQFNTNLDAVRRANLQGSAKLLQLSRNLR
jgi:hypothetical protein